MQPDLTSFQRQFVRAIDAPAAGALAVYRNTVMHGAVEALQSNYPVVAQLVGPEMFEGIAVDFVQAQPPRSAVLALYGGTFAEWMERQPWIADIAYLPDVARVERLHVECLFAKDAPALTAPSLSQAEYAADLRLTLHPALRFTWLSSPAMSIWLAHQGETAPELDIDWSAEGALFTRSGSYELQAAPLGRAAHRILCGLRIGETVSRSLAAAARLYPDECPETLLNTLLNLGAFALPTAERI